MSTATGVALPAGATSADAFDPEDGTRLIRADLGKGVILWAEEVRDGQLKSIGVLLDEDACENGFTAAQLRDLIPVLERAADLADQWAGVSNGNGTVRP